MRHLLHAFWVIGQHILHLWDQCTYLLLPNIYDHVQRAQDAIAQFERDRLETDPRFVRPAGWVGHLSHHIAIHPSGTVETVALVPVGQSATTKETHLLDLPIERAEDILAPYLRTLWWWQRPILITMMRGRAWSCHAEPYTIHGKMAALKRRAERARSSAA